MLVERFNSLPDLVSKCELLLNVKNYDIEVAKGLVNELPFETLSMVLDECTNLDDIFVFLDTWRAKFTVHTCSKVFS